MPTGETFILLTGFLHFPRSFRLSPHDPSLASFITVAIFFRRPPLMLLCRQTGPRGGILDLLLNPPPFSSLFFVSVLAVFICFEAATTDSTCVVDKPKL